jgi:hypothetical protein
MNKCCVECKEIKNLQFFGKDKSSKDGCARRCKVCQKEHSRKYRELNIDRIRKNKIEYISNNKEIINSKQRERWNQNKKEINLARRKFYKENTEIFKKRYLKNKDNIKLSKKKYRANNKDKIKEYDLKNKDRKNKKKVELRKLNPNKRVQHCLQTRIRTAIKSMGGEKFGHTEELIGCSIQFYKEYLESKFTKGMTWENYGVSGWHIDHIKPCVSFDLSDPKQQKLCFHYTNTQPLWATKEIAMYNGEDSNYIGNLEKQHH